VTGLGRHPEALFRDHLSLNGFRIVALKGDVSRLAGMFKGRRQQPLSIEDMDQAVADAAVARYKRSAPARSK
jgi:hypothetical protein